MQPVDGHRRIRRGAAGGVLSLATLVALLLGTAAPGVASGSTAPATNSPIADKQAEAARIAATLQGEAIRLAELSQRLDGAQVHADRVAAELVSTQRQLATTAVWLAATRSVLRRQGIQAYVLGGRPPAITLKGPEGTDDLLRRQAYAASVATIERTAIRQLRALSGKLAEAQAALKVENAAAQALVVQIARDRAAAAAADAAEQATLAQVEGDLATLVHAEQAQMAAAVAVRLKAEFARPPVRVATEASPTSRSAGIGSAASGWAASSSAVSGSAANSSATSRSMLSRSMVGSSVSRATTASTSPRPTLPASPPAAFPAPRVISRARATAPPIRFGPPAPRAPTPPPTAAPLPAAPPPPSGNAPAPGWQIALGYAEAQLGKRYLWGGAGPSSFDCSGLTMMAWGAAGVGLDHYAPDQYAATRRIPIPDLQPGDLVFYGSPSNVYHVGIYVGGGVMIQAPSTGQVVSYSTIYFTGLFAGGRVY